MDGFFIGLIAGLIISAFLSYVGNRVDKEEEEEKSKKEDMGSRAIYTAYKTFIDKREALVSLSDLTGEELIYDKFAMKEIDSARDIAIFKIVEMEADRIAKEVSRTGKSSTREYPRPIREDVFKGLIKHFSKTEVEVIEYPTGKYVFRHNNLL